MRKTYIIPATTVEDVDFEQILAESGVRGFVDDTPSSGFGGVDIDGSIDPEVRGNASWGDEW